MIGISGATTRPASAPRCAGLFAAPAISSALLSNFDGIGVEAGRLFGYPALPGVYFGLALATGLALCGTRRTFALVVIAVAVVAAWIVALQTAVSVYTGLGELVRGSAMPRGLRELLTMGAAGLCGGFVGSLLSAAAVSLYAPDFRSRANFARTIILGTLAGLLLVFFDTGKGFAAIALPEDLQLLPLFLVWQPAVAASIGYALARTPDS